MADFTKFAAVNGGTLFQHCKIQFSAFTTKKTVTLALGLLFGFIAFTFILTVVPSSTSYSLSLADVFTARNNGGSVVTNSSSSSSVFLDWCRSHFCSYLLPNSSQSADRSPSPSPNVSYAPPGLGEEGPVEFLAAAPVSQIVNNSAGEFLNRNSGDGFDEEVDNNQSVNRTDDLIKSAMKCDLFDGKWVRDESYPLYKAGSCSLIDPQFNCFRNGRPDNGYTKLKWKPKLCDLPRLNGRHMLEMLREKRLVFVGDSLNRNMWESLICILKKCVKDQTRVYEESGSKQLRRSAHFSFRFEDYNCTIEFFVSPFLVQERRFRGDNGTARETLRLDIINTSSDQYKNADIFVFNTGHWWTHEKTSRGVDYYQEGSHVHDFLDANEAFRRALTTWGRWVDAHIDPTKSLVFFRGYSASHFSGGQWNSGGQCDEETEPIYNEAYISEYPPKMMALETVLEQMRTPVTYLNVTRMTDYRKDGHPSIYRRGRVGKQSLSSQDCSHWCLPGVPDAWNEILYAQLLMKLSKSDTIIS